MLINITKEDLQNDLELARYAEIDGNIYSINPAYLDEDNRVCLAFYNSINDCYEHTFPWDDDFILQHNDYTGSYLLSYPTISRDNSFCFRLLQVIRKFG